METASQATSAESSARRGYEPPRIEELGTVDELTMGLAVPGSPDNTVSFGTMTVSDRRLKRSIVPVDTRRVLAQVTS